MELASAHSFQYQESHVHRICHESISRLPLRTFIDHSSRRAYIGHMIFARSTGSWHTWFTFVSERTRRITERWVRPKTLSTHPLGSLRLNLFQLRQHPLHLHLCRPSTIKAIRMSGIRIGSPSGGGGFHDLERSASPSPASFAYRDHPITTTLGTTDGEGGAVVITPTGSEGYRDDPRGQGYHDYEEGDEDDGTPSHSLPHVEDVRMRAMSIINQSGRGGSAVAPASIFFCLAHLCTTRSGWLCMALLGLIVIISLSIGLHNRNAASSGSGSGSGSVAAPPNAPSAFPYPGFTFVSEREKQIVWYLLDVTNYIALNDTSSPQRRAAQWLAVEDTYPVPLPAIGNVNVQTEHIPFLQRYAIVTLYYGLQGPTWNSRGKSLSWMIPSSHECNWNRPVSTSTSSASSSTDDEVKTTTTSSLLAPATVLGVVCNNQRAVTGIWLDGVNTKKRSATLPNEISLLPILSILNLNNNNIYGIPKSLSQVTTLTSLSMARNRLDGPVPFASLPLPQLRFLDLSETGLNGAIPEQSYFPRIKFLYLSNNTLTGSLPQAMAAWTNLKVLALDRNQLAGSLPPVLNQLWKLEQVYLEQNYFSGSLDGFYQDIGNKRLQIFDVSHNKLTGSVPSSLFAIPSVNILDLHLNKFSGTLPQVTAAENVLQLQYINLKSNELTASIPFSWGNLRMLTHLDLSFTQMNGVIPETFQALTNLAFLYLTDYEIQHRNPSTRKLDHSFPLPLKSMMSLKELGLHNTGLTGTIPTWMGQLSLLRVLALDRNSLSGSIPTELGDLTQMRFLLLEKNNLQGTVPTQFGNMRKLQVLLVELNAGLNGTISNSTAICKKGLDVFVADCGDTKKPQITCDCCTSCCSSSLDQTCLNQDFTVVDQDNWRQGYNTPIVYNFGDRTVTMGPSN